MNEHPLMLDGWLKFNEYKWGLKSQILKFNLKGENSCSVEMVIYLDKKGHIVLPKLNPFLPTVFHPTPTGKVSKLRHQWLSVSELLVKEFKKRGLKSSIALPPEIIDVRVWQWQGFLTEPRYTFYLGLPINLSDVDPIVRKNINRAKNEKFYVLRTYDFEKVIECLSDTEKRQNFSYRLTKDDLEVAAKFLGEENFRCYIAFAPNNEPASARIVLKGNNEMALDWVAGTKKKFLNSGITNYLISFILDDLVNSGTKIFDFNGANLPTVQEAKSNWGGELKVYYTLRPLNLRTFLGFGLRWLKSKR